MMQENSYNIDTSVNRPLKNITRSLKGLNEGKIPIGDFLGELRVNRPSVKGDFNEMEEVSLIN
jgi:Mn-dependent DtxR family transcriptional regulator